MRIKKIKNLLSRSPLGKTILTWASENDIKIYMDYQCNGARGYYTVSSKSVCLNAKKADADLAHVLAHELRHAWQDSQNLIPTLFTSPTEILQQIRFIEADAYAHQMQCYWEITNNSTDYYSHVDKETQYILARNNPTDNSDLAPNDTGKALWILFNDWMHERRELYDAYTIQCCAHKLGLHPQWKPLSAEFNNAIDVEYTETLAARPKDTLGIYKVGEMFNGRNYFAHSISPVNERESIMGCFNQKTQTLITSINTIIEKKRQQNPSLKPFHFGS